MFKTQKDHLVDQRNLDRKQSHRATHLPRICGLAV